MLSLAQAPGSASSRRRGQFVPQTVPAPKTFLSPWAAARAAMRNPLELWDEALFELPYRDIRRGGRRYFEVVDPALMHAVLVTHEDAFCKSDIQQRYIKPALGNGLLAAEGEAWRLQRPAAAPCFRNAALEALVPTMGRVGEQLVTRLLQRPKPLTDVMPELMWATFAVVAELMFGDEAAHIDQATMAQAVTDYVETIALADWIDIAGGARWLHARPWPKRGRRGLSAMRAAAIGMLTARRADHNPHEDLLQRLLNARDRHTGQAMSSIDVRDNILTFLTAGNETTALTLTWALYLIANDPDVQDRLAAEADAVLGDDALRPDHIEALHLHLQVIKEAMRLYPPIAILQRRALRTVDIGPATLNAGDEVVCASYVMHRSRLYWEHPEAFDPDRFAPARAAGRHKLALMPFGAGRHVCIGKPLAFMETVALLALMTRRLRFEANPMHPIRPIMRLTVRPEGGMPLKVRARTAGSATTKLKGSAHVH